MADPDDDGCNGAPADTTHFSLRVMSIFIILAASLLGVFIPILLERSDKNLRHLFFVFKFVGSGVIIATAWMHLLAPAAEELGDPCLKDRLGDYDWAFFIGLATILAMFLAEILATHFAQRAATGNGNMGRADSESAAGSNHDMGGSEDDGATNPGQDHRDETDTNAGAGSTRTRAVGANEEDWAPSDSDGTANSSCGSYPSTREPLVIQRHVKGHDSDSTANMAKKDHTTDIHKHHPSSLAGQLTAVLILEFGVVFHSVFIGLVLATTDNLVLLLVVLVFHQFMEGLGLGSRLATVPSWSGSASGSGSEPRRRSWVPYFLACGFALSTPVGIAAGLAAKPRTAAAQTLTNGVFDAVSAGILMYTGLVELLAHEFLLDPGMRSAPLARQMGAYGSVVFGAGAMALLAKWA